MIVWAICLVMLIMALGIVVDLTLQMSSKQKTQNIADSIALSSAIYVSHTGHPPQNNSEGFMNNVQYSAADLGYSFPGSADVNFKVIYDDVSREARVELTGNLSTKFLQVIQVNQLEFNASSTAKYKEVDSMEPASVVFVMDNSGSMWFDDKPVDEYNNPPDDAVRRIDAVKSTLVSFNSYLSQILIDGTGDDTTRYLRTGLLPYNHDIIASDVVQMHWGILNEQSHINPMTPGGATNSSPPIANAWTWLQTERVHHVNENGNADPMRFVIFMTDGNNTAGSDIWVPEDGTGTWRKLENERRCNRRRCRWVSYYEYYTQSEDDDGDEPEGSGWEEGRIFLTSDVDTMAACEDMKNAGVKVYTIGFALEAGTFATNDWSNHPSEDFYVITPETKERSSAVLAACASAPEHFLLAEDADSLEAVFDLIGNDILKEVVRLAN
ncbi:MAG: hypothetical protein HKN36_11235 [Hellea sp.]|nr:hypothetical protein [Hellea sp.]